MSHLTSISSAVSHMVNHLVANNIIPPLPPREFPQGVLPNYEMPDRDMTVLQGWNAEKNREDESRKKGKRKGTRQDPTTDPDDDDDDLGTMVPSNGNGQHWAHVGPPPNHHHQGHNYHNHLQPHPSLHPSMMHQLPPYRAPGHPGQVQLTPTSELDLPPRQLQYPLPPLAPSPSASGGMHPPPTAHSLPQMPGQHIPNHSPAHSMPNVTPNSMIASSISPVVHGNGLPPPPNDALSIIVHPEVEDILADAKTSPPQPVPMYDEAGNIIIGSADGRNNIIKQGLISPQDATFLVDQSVLLRPSSGMTMLTNSVSIPTWHRSYLVTSSNSIGSHTYQTGHPPSHLSSSVFSRSCQASVFRLSTITEPHSPITSKCSSIPRRPSRGKTSQLPDSSRTQMIPETYSIRSSVSVQKRLSELASWLRICKMAKRSKEPTSPSLLSSGPVVGSRFVPLLDGRS